jgi:octaprenyl-diphosphate synthase
MTEAALHDARSTRAAADAFAPIARELEEVERILAQAIRNDDAGIKELVEHISQYRGKRLRPTLLLLTGLACGSVTPSHCLLAAVIELIHTATLVHDDVLDGALVRRHVATVNSRWGTQTSVLMGDYLFTHAFHLCTTLGNIRVCQIIGQATNRTCEAELLQCLEQGNLALSEPAYLRIIEGKTAELISCSARLGAMMSGMSDEVADQLAHFGRLLGLAFQIADDLLDLVGDETTTGKSLGTDVDQRKMTLPLIRLLNGQANGVASKVRQILTGAGNHKREALRPYLIESGAIAGAQARAEEYARAACRDLECLPDSATRDILTLICNRVVHRDH